MSTSSPRVRLDRSALAHAVRAHRGDASLRDVESATGVGFRTVWRAEGGTALIDADDLAALLAWMGRPLEDFVVPAPGA